MEQLASRRVARRATGELHEPRRDRDLDAALLVRPRAALGVAAGKEALCAGLGPREPRLERLTELVGREHLQARDVERKRRAGGGEQLGERDVEAAPGEHLRRILAAHERHLDEQGLVRLVQRERASEVAQRVGRERREAARRLALWR